MRLVVVILTMIATTKNPIKKTMSKMNMYMMTTVTTVLHRVLKVDWSNLPFSLANVFVFRLSFGLYGVAVASYSQTLRVSAQWEFAQCASEEPTRCRKSQVMVVEVVVRRTQTREVSKMVT